VFRKDIIERSRVGFFLKRWFYALLALGVTDLSEESLALDKKIIGVLAAIGIPSACVLHGYVGFIFGAIKSNPLWSTPLMPLIFLLSAIVSGIAMLILMYMFVMKVTKKAINVPCIYALCKYFWGFLILAITLEELQVLTMGYMAQESWGIISVLLSEKLWFSYNWLQVYIGALIPLVLLGIVTLRPLKDSTKITFAALSSFLILVQVFAMRWNVVIGGQLFSKSLRGFTDYNLPFLGREGMLVAIILFSLPFITFYVCSLILPIFKDEGEAESNS
jgi:Ni/Fe-hydrogenase subunit HybB-like protein